MAQPALRLVHNQSFARSADDLAITLLFTTFGLLCQVAVWGSGAFSVVAY